MPRQFTLPESFENKIKGTEEEASLRSMVNTLSPLFDDNRMTFFPEYTNHGFDHIQEVINASENLIEEQTKNNLTSSDILFLVGAILTHDIGMQLTEDGFKLLINGALDSYRNPYFDKLTWFEEWQNFLSVSKKFNDKEQLDIYGEHVTLTHISELEQNELKSYNQLHKRLIGEFLRRNHARLAHETITGGFPGKGIIIIGENIDQDKRDLIGLIARSHNMNVRDTFSYLKKKDKRVWFALYKSKPIYLMILLRLADLIQIHASRAPRGILSFRSLSSPISVKEWSLHNSVKDITTLTDDPEAIHVTSDPPTSKDFIKLQSLLKYIQYELDLSWAIIGEVYASNLNLSFLKVKYRRITSNIDDVGDFEDRVSYIPQSIHFDTSPELSKLLVAPLYGHHPTYGVRELLQNAVDACNSREFFEKLNGSEYSPFVNIKIEKREDGFYFIIKDNGIGMDKDILVNYFLKAGASFKKSTRWKNITDETGNIQFQRAGRFGIGALAMFLIGDEVKVVTQPFDSIDEGLTFNAKLDQDQIEVQKIKGQIGTTIEILMSASAVDLVKQQLNNRNNYNDTRWFNWFCLTTPTVTYNIPSEWKYNLPKIKKQPNVNQQLEQYQFSFTPKGFEKVIWTFNEAPKLLCNGIRIPNGYRIGREYSSIMNSPNLSVFDFNEQLPLSLDRESIDSYKLPFEEELAVEIYKDFIAFALSIGTVQFPSKLTTPYLDYHNHPSIKSEYGNRFLSAINRVVFCKDGFTFLNKSSLEVSNIKILIEVWANEIDADIITIPESVGVIFHVDPSSSIDTVKRFIDRSSNFYSEDVDGEKINYSYGYYSDKLHAHTLCLTRRITLRTKDYQYYFDPNINRLPNPLKNICNIDEVLGDWTTLLYQDAKSTLNFEENQTHNFKYITDKNIDPRVKIIVTNYIDKFLESDNEEDIIFENLLKQYLGDYRLIPYSIKDRAIKYPFAFEELKSFLSNYGAIEI